MAETRRPNYEAVASAERRHLQERGYCGIENIVHINPLTTEQCNGTLVIAFSSWKEAMLSGPMRETGSVGYGCASCGDGGFINAHKQIVKQYE